MAECQLRREYSGNLAAGADGARVGAAIGEATGPNALEMKEDSSMQKELQSHASYSLYFVSMQTIRAFAATI